MKHPSLLSLGTAASIPSLRAFEPLAVAAFVLPPLAAFAPLGLAPLFLAATLAVIARNGTRSFAAIGGMKVLAGLLAALVLWSLLSASWSVLPKHSLVEGLRLLGISIGGLVLMGGAQALSPEERARLGAAATGGVILAVLLLVTERLSHAAILRLMLDPASGVDVRWSHFDRGSTTLVLALWPALSAALAAGRRWQAAVMALAVLVVALLLVSMAAKVAAVLGLVAFAAAWRAPRGVAAMLAGGIVALTIALPLATPDFRGVAAIHQEAPWLKESAIHRLLIWRFTSDRIADRPLLGWGMDASRDLPGGHADLHALAPATGVAEGAEALPLHPHDALLQWRVELGWPGALLGVAVILWGLWRTGWQARLSPARRAGALAWAAAALVVALVAYGIWQAWWLSCLWLTAATYVGTGPAVPSQAVDER
jgi:O-antigen ligase